jgi:hypothetical protein
MVCGCRLKNIARHADVSMSTMEHSPLRTASFGRSAARKCAVAAIAAAVSVGLAGCGSGLSGTAKATAVFRQIVKHQYNIAAGRCARSTPARWTCRAHINDPAKEIDVDFHGTVWRSDGQWTEAGSRVVLGAPPAGQ